MNSVDGISLQIIDNLNIIDRSTPLSIHDLQSYKWYVGIDPRKRSKPFIIKVLGNKALMFFWGGGVFIKDLYDLQLGAQSDEYEIDIFDIDPTLCLRHVWENPVFSPAYWNSIYFKIKLLAEIDNKFPAEEGEFVVNFIPCPDVPDPVIPSISMYPVDIKSEVWNSACPLA